MITSPQGSSVAASRKPRHPQSPSDFVLSYAQEHNWHASRMPKDEAYNWGMVHCIFLAEATGHFVMREEHLPTKGHDLYYLVDERMFGQATGRIIQLERSFPHRRDGIVLLEAWAHDIVELIPTGRTLTTQA